MPDEEAVSGPRAVERLTYFSDAVIAIAITLLAIDLPVPNGSTVSELWTSFRHDDGHYAAFLISFAVISAAWRDHYSLFRHAKGTDAWLLLLDSGWLLTIVLNPFATRLLVASNQTVATHALRFGFYALLQVLESAMLYVMLRYLTAHQLAGLPDLAVQSQARKSYILMLAFGLSIPVFFATTYAWVLWFAAPLLATRRDRWRRNGPDRGQPRTPPG